MVKPAGCEYPRPWTEQVERRRHELHHERQSELRRERARALGARHAREVLPDNGREREDLKPKFAKIWNIWPNFGGLVPGCIEADY